MRKVVRGVGGFEHSAWRSFCNERKTTDARGFVDGDLLELFLDLGLERMQLVILGHRGAYLNAHGCMSACTWL